MKNIALLMSKLNGSQRDRLRLELQSSDTLYTRYLQFVLNAEGSSGKETKFGEKLSRTSLHKTKSLAHDYLLEWIGANACRNLDASADLIWWFCSNGLYKEGWEYYRKEEKKLSGRQDYKALHSLYVEAMRLQIYISDLGAMEELRDKAQRNAARLAEYTAVQTAYSVEIARLENPRLSISSAYERSLLRLLKQAQRLDHHNLVSNVLYCLFVYYTRHDFSLTKAHGIVREMIKAVDRYTHALSPYAKAVLANNIAQFTLLYDVEEHPEPFIKLIQDGLPNAWQNLGKIGLCGYYSSLGQTKKLRAMRKTIDESNVSIDKELASLAKLDLSIAWEDLKSGSMSVQTFRRQIDSFYSLNGRRIYRELDFMVRTQEILLLVFQGSLETALSKVDALRKFHERSMNSGSEQFGIIIQPFHSAIKALLNNRHPSLREPKHHTVRWTKWAITELRSLIDKGA